MTERICLVTCFLPIQGELRRFWESLDGALADRGLRLVVMGSAPPPPDSQLPFVQIPFSLLDMHRRFVTPAGTAARSNVPGARELVERDTAWCGDDGADADEREAGLHAAAYLAGLAADTLAPSHALLWSRVLPQSLILRDRLDRRGIPAHFVERGLFPGTLMIEQEWESSPAEAVRMATGEDEAVFEQARRFYLSEGRSKYPQSGREESGALRERLGLSGKRIVLFLGQHDVASGLVPRGSDLSREMSPLFDSTRAALDALATAASTLEDTVVLFKPHPHDLSWGADRPNGSVRVVTGGDLHSLCAAADTIAAMSTTAQFEALLHDKPMISLGQSRLTGTGVVFEAEGAAGLSGLIASALADAGREGRLAAARAFVARCMARDLFDCGGSSPARCGASDLAGLIARTATRAGRDEDRLGGASERAARLEWMLRALERRAAANSAAVAGESREVAGAEHGCPTPAGVAG